MNSHHTRLLTLCVLVCCMFAVASTASTLDESVSTDPSDAIDPDWEKLPIGKEKASELRERAQSEPADAGTPSADASTDGGDRRDEQSASGEGTAQGSSGGEAGDAGTSGGSDGSEARAASGGHESDGGSKTATVSLLTLLFSLLRPLLLGVLVLGVLVGGVVVFRRLRPERSPTDGDGSTGLSRPVGSPSPSNDVSRAWFELMHRFGVADEHQLTPRERAELAIERGAEPDSVRALTGLFERTRYGHTSVTDATRDRAEKWLDRATEGRDSRREWA